MGSGDRRGPTGEGLSGVLQSLFAFTLCSTETWLSPFWMRCKLFSIYGSSLEGWISEFRSSLEFQQFRIGIFRCCWGRRKALAHVRSREKILLHSEVCRRPRLTAVQCVLFGAKWSPEQVGLGGFLRRFTPFRGLSRTLWVQWWSIASGSQFGRQDLPLEREGGGRREQEWHPVPRPLSRGLSRCSPAAFLKRKKQNFEEKVP